MRKTFITITQIAALVLMTGLVVNAQDKKVDPTGNWTWTVPGRDGGPERKMSLDLKVEGEKVMGKLKAPGRDGATTETEIADGKLAGETISFTVTREFNGNKRVSKYNGKVSADAITGKVESEGRDGQSQSRDWNAKREASAAK